MSIRRGGALVRMLGPAACLLVTVLFAYWLISLFALGKRTAWRASCEANMRQLSNGMRMYIEDYDGKLPLAQKWQDATLPYVKSLETSVCPARPQMRPGYAFNQRLDGMNSRKAARPEQTPMLFESNRGQRNGADRLGSFITPHEGSNGTIGFLDGHVKAFTAPLAADAGLRTNTPKQKRDAAP